MVSNKAPFGPVTLSRLFALTAMACVVAASMGSSGRIVVALVVICLLASIIGHRVADAPISYGAMAGVVTMALLGIGHWLMHAVGFLFHDGQIPYFVDGVLVELVVYPLDFGFYVLILGGLMGMLIGSAIAFVVWLGSCVTDAVRAKRHPTSAGT